MCIQKHNDQDEAQATEDQHCGHNETIWSRMGTNRENGWFSKEYPNILNQSTLNAPTFSSKQKKLRGYTKDVPNPSLFHMNVTDTPPEKPQDAFHWAEEQRGRLKRRWGSSASSSNDPPKSSLWKPHLDPLTPIYMYTLPNDRQNFQREKFEARKKRKQTLGEIKKCTGFKLNRNP